MEECVNVCKKCSYNTIYGYFNCVSNSEWSVGRIITFVLYILVGLAVVVGLCFMFKRCASPDFEAHTKPVVVECEGNVTGVIAQPTQELKVALSNGQVVTVIGYFVDGPTKNSETVETVPQVTEQKVDQKKEQATIPYQFPTVIPATVEATPTFPNIQAATPQPVSQMPVFPEIK